MRKFLKYIIVRSMLLCCVLFLLEFVYTKVYTSKSNIRNKVEFVFQNSDKRYDYIFLGSSRVEYHVDTNLINEECNVSSLNMGMSGQNLTETFLLLKLLQNENIKSSKYYIQIDENDMVVVNNKKSFIASSYYMPFKGNNEVRNHLEEYDSDYFLDVNVPFFRYMNYGYKIGYRELLLKISNRPRKLGFYIGLEERLKEYDSNLYFKDNYNNTLINKIKIYANRHKLDLIFYTSPYFQAKNSEKFKSFLKENKIFNYLDSLKQMSNFKDETHLNRIGSRKFTKMLIRDFSLTR